MTTTASFKNGLTQAQIEKAREIFSKVSLRRLCKDMGISVSVINNVLRDQSGRVDLLKQVIDAANAKIKEREVLLASIPAQ